ncbi:hypothetical protein ACOSQ2_031223 [Xanthoceras sorbifolium]
MAGSGERRLVVATAVRSSEVGLQVHAAVDGDASLTETAALKKNSDLMAPAMASSAEGERAASLGAAKGVLLRVETAPSGMGKSVATVSLGAGAASNVARSSPLAAQVHGHLAHADTSQVLGHPTHEGAAHVHSHLALEGAAHVHGPLVLESAAHVQPCLALPDGHACDACAHPCTALACALPVHVGAGHVQPFFRGRDSSSFVSNKYWSTVGDGVVAACLGCLNDEASGQKINFDKSALCVSKQVAPGFLWGLNIPAKVRMFVWRACRNLLPTRSLLAARRVPVGAGCPLCGADVDSVLHSLWLCRTLVESKAAVPFLAGLRLPAVGSFFDFIIACSSVLLVQEMELLLVLLWRFWFRRNRAVHSAPLLTVEDTVGWSELFLADFQAAAAAAPSLRCPPPVERWQAPSPGWIKINSDVAVDARGRRLGFGVVFRDSVGEVLVSYTSLLPGLFSSDIGEALAILLGLRLAGDMGFPSVCVESDAASVVKQLSSRAPSCSDIGLILDDILSLVGGFADISFSSVRRSANKVAHGLAKFALSHQPVGVRIRGVPSSVAFLVLDDSRSYP